MMNQAHLQITGLWRALLWPVYPPCESYSPILPWKLYYAISIISVVACSSNTHLYTPEEL
jgi:hypothetical protein